MSDAELADDTLVLLLWGCDMSNEHGGLRERHYYKNRWQAAPTSFGGIDGPGSNFRQWLRLFSSHEPVCLGELPANTGFRRLHVGDRFLDHFTSLGAKPTQYHGFVHYMAEMTHSRCRTPPHAPPHAHPYEHRRAVTRATKAATAASKAEHSLAARSSHRSLLPLVLALDKPEGRRRPLGLAAAVAYLRRRLDGTARVLLLRGMNESMPACEQLGWLQAADVLITPAGGISIASAFLRPGTSVISFGVPAPNHQRALGAWDYDLVRLQVNTPPPNPDRCF